MGITIETEDKTLIAHLSGDIDHHSAAALREQIDSSAERIAPALLRLDFANVGFMDSSGIGLIMGRYRLMCALGGRLTVGGLSPALERMVHLAGLERLAIWETKGGETV